MAKDEGLDLKDLIECSVEGYNVICSELIAQKTEGSSHIVSIYNSNIGPIEGFFLRVPLDFLSMNVEVLNESEGKFIVVASEAFCEMKILPNMCDVDVEA